MGWIIGKGIGVPFRLGGSGLGSSYWKAQILLKYTSRSGLDLLETGSGNNRNAKILPACGLLTDAGSNNYARKAVAGFGSADSSGYLEFRGYFASGMSYYPFASTDESRTDRHFILRVSNNIVSFIIRDPAGTPSTNHGGIIANAVSDGWHTVRFISNGSNWSFTVDGVNNPIQMTSGSNIGLWLNHGTPNSRDNILIGALIESTPTYSVLGYIDYVNYNNANLWIVPGVGSYIYDLIGIHHLTWYGSNHLAYVDESQESLLDNGYSIWQKAGQSDEFVQYKSGSPFDVSAFLAGYTKLADYPGGADIYNYAPSLIDFDPTDSAHADLDVFDKSNSEHHIATAGMSYYDAAQVYRWRQDELAAPQTYSDTYKNVGYKGRMMIKGTVVSSLVKDLSEILVLKTDQTGVKEWKLAQLCTIEDLVVQAGGVPVFDGDNYLTWI